MLKTLAFAASLLALTGCSSADEDAQPDATKTEAGAPSAAGTSTIAQLTPSPLEECEGYFEPLYSGRDKEWLHRTEVGCMLGRFILLRENGTYQYSEREFIDGNISGTWSGDSLYFTLKSNPYTLNPGTPGEKKDVVTTVPYRRLPQEPSTK